jgi:hypothetical protein
MIREKITGFIIGKLLEGSFQGILALCHNEKKLIYKALKDQNWQYKYQENGNLEFFNKNFPDVIIVVKDTNELFDDFWLYSPAPSYKVLCTLKYKDKVINDTPLIGVFLDGARGLRMAPSRWSSGNDLEENILCAYYFIDGSYPHLLDKIFQQCVPSDPLRTVNFTIFPSTESADSAFISDLRQEFEYYNPIAFRHRFKD